MPYIDIPQKTVEFEDGRKEDVSPFSIATSCITLAQFLDFQNATGYITQGEKLGTGHYLLNAMNGELSTTERLHQTAFCMAYVDADAYCEWSKVRLPSEAEWIAASLIDNIVYDLKSGDRPDFIDRAGTLLKARLPYYLELKGFEITSSFRDENHVILRSGPMYFRDSSWNEKYHGNYDIRKIDVPELLACFRVCKPS